MEERAMDLFKKIERRRKEKAERERQSMKSKNKQEMKVSRELRRLHASINYDNLRINYESLRKEGKKGGGCWPTLNPCLAGPSHKILRI